MRVAPAVLFLVATSVFAQNFCPPGDYASTDVRVAYINQRHNLFGNPQSAVAYEWSSQKLVGAPPADAGVGAAGTFSAPTSANTFFTPTQLGLMWITLRATMPDGSFRITNLELFSIEPLGDFDGDGRSDIAVFRPVEGGWHIRLSNGGFMTILNFGASPGARPYVGDFSGDGRADLAVYVPAEAAIYWRSSSNGAVTRTVVLNGDQPGARGVAGDFDGDGLTELNTFFYTPDGSNQGAIFSNSRMKYQTGRGTAFFAPVGSNPVPVVGDYDGDGFSDNAVFIPTTGEWFIERSSTRNFAKTKLQVCTPLPGDRAAPADYDGDGITDPAIFRPSTGSWHILLSTGGQHLVGAWGKPGDVPIPADYDNDGRADIGVYRQTDLGGWHIMLSGGGFLTVTGWGMHPGDIPLTGAPMP